MVRVFSAYHYRGQSIHSVHEDISASCLMNDDHIILAKSNHVIEIRSVHRAHDDLSAGVADLNDNNDNSSSDTTAVPSATDDTAECVASFPTVDQVLNVLHCKQGNYILTLEVARGRRQPHGSNMGKMHCRVYTNWWCSESNAYNTTIRARIAGKTTPTTSDACLEVIELQPRDSPRQIGCCQVTGNIVVATEAAGLLVYRLQQCVIGASKWAYIDFCELPFVMDLDFVADRVAMTEHCVAAGNAEFTVVLKVIESGSIVRGSGRTDEMHGSPHSDDAISANSLNTNTSTSDETSGGMGQLRHSARQQSQSLHHHHHQQRYRRTIGGGIDLELGQPDDWDVRLVSTQDNAKTTEPRRSSLSEYRPIHIDIECQLRSLAIAATPPAPTYALKPLLRIRQRDARDPFRCMSLKPIYMQRHVQDDATIKPASHPMRASRRQSASDTDAAQLTGNLMGIVVLVATANDGYVYQFSNNDAWVTEDNHFVAAYPFTAPVIDAQLHDYVLHALTDRGIETYTLRQAHKVFSSGFEYALRDDAATTQFEACPRLEDPICLIGLRPFLGVRRLHCSDRTLVLMAATVNRNTDATGPLPPPPTSAAWTMYALRLPLAEDLYADFVQLAEQHRADSPATYALLLGEAHMILRTAVEFMRIVPDGEQARLQGASDAPTIQTVYVQSCRQLADYCVVSSVREEYCAAFPYYTMAGVGAAEVYERVLAMRTPATCMIGLIHTLKNMFVKVTQSGGGGAIEDLARILSGTRATCGTTFGDELLTLFLAEAPHEIGVVTLRSQMFRDLMSTRVCIAIETKQERTAEDRMCLVLDAVRNNEVERARMLLRQMCADQLLFGVLIQYWCVLFDAAHIKRTGRRMTTFSELTEAYLLVASPNGDGGVTATPPDAELQRCTANVFVYLTIDAKVVTLDLMLKLLMDHLASRVCQMGYATGQLVMQTLLEAYLFDLYVRRRYAERGDADVTAMATTQVNGQTGESMSEEMSEPSSMASVSSSGSSSSCSLECATVSQPSGGARRQRCAHRPSMTAHNSPTPASGDHCARAHHHSRHHHIFAHPVHSEAMKILVRIYLGKLKKFQFDGDGGSGEKQQPPTATPTVAVNRAAFFKFMRLNLDKLYEHHKSYAALQRNVADEDDADEVANVMDDCHEERLASNEPDRISLKAPKHGGGNVALDKRPILFLAARPAYLNDMHPFEGREIAGLLGGTGAGTQNSSSNSGIPLGNDIQLTVIKFQSILASGRLTRDVLQEIIYFFEANSPVLGIDSYISLLLPPVQCTYFFIEHQTHHLQAYVEARFVDERQWSEFLIQLLEQKPTIVAAHSAAFFENLLKGILQYLIGSKRLTQIIKIFPIKNVETGDLVTTTKMTTKTEACDVDYDGIGVGRGRVDGSGDNNMHNEEMLFTKFLTEAIDRDRAERLGEMIKTTGYQLYETYNRNKQFFN